MLINITDRVKLERDIAQTVHQHRADAQVWLYGSRARGDYRQDSDWDVLILLDQERVTERDHEQVAFPLYDLGIDNDTLISPKIYTVRDWERRSFTPFYKSVTRDRIRLT